MAQRLRIAFARRDGASYLSHLEMMRMWERALRRAGWRLAYSQGFNPHPKISFAAPLAVAVAAERDLLEVYLEVPRPVEAAREELDRQMPPGFRVLAVDEVPADTPPLQVLMAAAEYLAVCPMETPRQQLGREVERVLAADSLPRQRAKEEKTVAYDLRPMVRSLGVETGSDGRPVVRMELRTDARGAGRADEVLRELGLDPGRCAITRTRLLLVGESD